MGQNYYFLLALLAICFMMTDTQQRVQGGTSSLLFELYSALVYLTFKVAVVLSVLSLRPSGGGAVPAMPWIEKTCHDLPLPSLLRIWFLPMAAVAVTLLLFLASKRWKDRSAVQDTVAEVPPVTDATKNPTPRLSRCRA
ncbi:unnamed protein product [Spirodela intermedia]|uniref:Uncharacterized protein n=1 Tax=Spirodela intermedia TaxID=51605 RepID=A0A7I8K3U1_SPIIN|nr:unnamed protein product [Spirodela intermedia]